MTSSLKRPISSIREISPPPPQKSRKQPTGAPPAPHASDVQSIRDQKGALRDLTTLLRIYSWNVNGIAPLLQRPITSFFSGAPQGSTSRPSTPLRSFLRRHKWPQVLCLQEVKIAPRDLATQRAVEQAVNDPDDEEGPEYSVRFCLPRDRHNARGFGGKMYGVATIVQSSLLEPCPLRTPRLTVPHRGTATATTTTRQVSWDAEGRVLVTTLPPLQLAILNIYAVNGTDSAYRDPTTGRVAGTRHERKRAFHALLLAESAALEKAGLDVLLVGDLNVALARVDSHPFLRTAAPHAVSRADFVAKFLAAPGVTAEEPAGDPTQRDPGSLHAVDTFRYFHGPTARRYTYYPRHKPWGSGCDRVDLMLASRRLVKHRKALVEADILDSELERGPSDHVPLYVILDLEKMAAPAPSSLP
ncbi:MAG: hypothetical protein M1838_000848 [Thelocarpon superellum]|nr:MAG: hypothetical protein M1838_000848 [Thelocarpon superellum]